MSKRSTNSFLRYHMKRFLYLAIKLAIVFGSGYFIYQKIKQNEAIDFITLLEKNKIFTLKNGSILLFLTFLNWFFEIFKWKILVSEIKFLSFFTATEQKLGALTASIFTPNRIGEYGAKAMYYPKKNRKQILGRTFIANLTQLSVTLFFGVIGFVLFITTYNPSIAYYRILKMGVYVVLLVVLFFINVPKKRFSIGEYLYGKIMLFFASVKNSVISVSFLLSILRYLIFAHQFYFLLLLFGVEINYLTAFIFISSFYLLVSIIPTIFVLDVVVKGGIAIWLFGFIPINELLIIATTLLMWLLNFAFPSVLGSYFVLKFKPVN